jgi:hypothetical protein
MEQAHASGEAAESLLHAASSVANPLLHPGKAAVMSMADTITLNRFVDRTAP